ncbi:hypothetical protein NQ314_021462 [Rhamnusium bicolor]|uniref:PiggyBac transposable element-derived protein domain-containing protein n=1 Tax=Rhamnusium bicolor TaxID=1586634 RepID=A0AAV8WK64_9CUCU|nr:hypothetical protein NQ314_021462 [Rhamnusium bicolor]
MCDGFVLNMEIYKGMNNSDDARKSSKVNSLVLRLMEPNLDKGHHLYIDNFYTSLNCQNVCRNEKLIPQEHCVLTENEIQRRLQKLN